MTRSDRIFGLVIILVALAMIVGATGFQEPFFASGPVGPKVFPMTIAGLMIICGLSMLARPDAEPEWPGAAALGRIAAAVVVMVAYAYMLKPMGFLLPTAITAGVIAFLIRPDILRATFAGIGLSVGLFLLFRFGLELTTIQAFPRGMFVTPAPVSASATPPAAVPGTAPAASPSPAPAD